MDQYMSNGSAATTMATTISTSTTSSSSTTSTTTTTPGKKQAAENLINLRTLKRKVDDGIDEILLSVCHACLYQFVPQTNGWQHQKIEGPLHVYQKGAGHGLVILNQNDIGHHHESLSPGFLFHVHQQFLQYKNDRDQIFCIWLFKASDVERVAKRITQLCQHQPMDGIMNGTFGVNGKAVNGKSKTASAVTTPVTKSRTRTRSLNMSNGTSSLSSPVVVVASSAPTTNGTTMNGAATNGTTNGISSNGHVSNSVMKLFQLYDQHQAQSNPSLSLSSSSTTPSPASAAAAASSASAQQSIMDILEQGYQKQKRISINAIPHHNNNHHHYVHHHNHHPNHLFQQNNIGTRH